MKPHTAHCQTFRRAVWLEARTAGLEVRGYKPTERDLQELACHQDARDVNTVSPARDRGPPTADGQERPSAAAEPAQVKPARIDYDKGLTGKLLESGEAPYKHRSGQELTPFLRVEQKDGRQVEVWEPLLTAAEQRWDIHFERVSGIIHRPQPPATLARLHAALAVDFRHHGVGGDDVFKAIGHGGNSSCLPRYLPASWKRQS